MSRPRSAKAARNPTKSDRADGSIFAARLARLKGLASAQGLSHILITSPSDVGYLTGFLGGDSYLVVGDEKPAIISDFRYQEELAPLEGLCRVVIRKGAMGEAVTAALEQAQLCGFQAEIMTVAERDALAKKLGPKRLAATTGIVSGMRRVKDEHEIELIRKAVKIQEQALQAILPTLRPGLTELAIAAQLEAEMKQRGASAPGFETIIAARANGSLPHYRPGSAKTAANQPLLIDWGAIYRGYHSDMTRTFCFGRWPQKMSEIYEIVLDAHQLAAAALAPGKRTSQIDAIARTHITKHGYGEHFGHGLGHGIGLAAHEDPRLSHMLAGTILEVGQVVTIEPGIYLPGVGGVRLEDDYLITETGAKNLCSLPLTLRWATLG